MVAVTMSMLVVWASAAAAHARLLRALPAPDGTVTTAPKEVRAWFSEELRPEGSTMTVWDRRGTRVDTGQGGVDLDDLDRMSMVVRLKPLQPGRYMVKWKAVAADDLFVAQGTFQFTVVPK